MENICPYCKSNLAKGFIDSSRYSFKWHKEDPNILEKYTIFGGEKLSEDTFIECVRCTNCNKIIIDLNAL